MKHARAIGLGWVVVAALAAGVLWPGGDSLGQPLKPHDVKALRQPQVDIEYQLGDSRATEVELWYTDDKSQSWSLYGVEPGRKSPISFTAPHEGLFGFMVIARNKAGASANTPTPGTEPMFWCYVVWRRPQVSITGPTPAAAEASGPGQVNLKPGEPLVITYSAVSDHLTETPIKIEYRLVNDQKWIEIAGNQPNTGKVAWQVPDSVRGPFLLRVTAADLAGNVSPATSLREIEIVRDEPRAHLAGTVGKPNPDSGTTIEPSPMTLTRQNPQAVPEPPASMPDAMDVALSPLRQQILPPNPPKYNDTAPPVRSGTGDVTAPSTPKSVGPAVTGTGTTETGASGEPANNAMDAVGMLVLEYTSPEPASAVKLEPTIGRLKAALRPLVDRGMLMAPIGVAREPLANSANLIKVVQLYAVIPSAQRKRAGDIERDAYENASAALKDGKLEGVMMTRFERAEPTPETTAVTAVGPAAGTGAGTGGNGPAVAVANNNSPSNTTTPSTPTTPNIRDERPTEIVPPTPNTRELGMPVALERPGATSRPIQPTVDNPAVAAGGRQDIALQFGPRQRDLKIQSPPPVEPAPAGSGIVAEAPALPAPSPMIGPIAPPPLKENVTTPAMDVQVARADLGVLEPIRPPTPTPSLATGSSGTTPGLTAPTNVPNVGKITSADATSPGTPPIAPVTTVAVGPTVAIEPPAAVGNSTTPSTSLGTAKVESGTPVVVAAARGHIDADKLAAAQKAFRDGLAAAFAANDRSRAAACYKDAIDNDPEMIEAYINLAGIQTLAQEYDKAELNYQRAVNLQPEHAKALFGLGSVQLLRKNPQIARETLGKLLRIRSSDAAAWVLYGDASLAVRENTSAISAWKEAIRLAPGTAIAKLAQDRLTRYGATSN